MYENFKAQVIESPDPIDRKIHEAQVQRKWFYFTARDEWKAPCEVRTMKYRGEEIGIFELRNPVEMLINYKK